MQAGVKEFFLKGRPAWKVFLLLSVPFELAYTIGGNLAMEVAVRQATHSAWMTALSIVMLFAIIKMLVGTIQFTSATTTKLGKFATRAVGAIMVVVGLSGVLTVSDVMRKAPITEENLSLERPESIDYKNDLLVQQMRESVQFRLNENRR